MTKRRRLAVLIPALVVLHLFFHLALGIGLAAPDLMTVALLLAARELGMGGGAGLGLALGLLEDSFSVLSFGANTFSMTVVGILGARTRDLFVGESLLFFFSYLLVGKLLREFIQWVVAGEEAREPFLHAVAINGTGSALYAAIVGILILIPFQWSEARR